MLKGVEFGGLSAAKEIVLLKALKRANEIEHTRTMLVYKAAILDTSDQASINEFNNLLKRYQEARDPRVVANREADVASKKGQLESLGNLSLGKLNFKKPIGDKENLTDLKKAGVIKII